MNIRRHTLDYTAMASLMRLPPELLDNIMEHLCLSKSSRLHPCHLWSAPNIMQAERLAALQAERLAAV